MTPILRATDLDVRFRVRRRHTVHALRGVSLCVQPGESVAVVGESGSGKSTLARALLRLVPIRSGQVEIAGTDVSRLRGRALSQLRRRAQLVFQDPYSSLDPSITVGRSVSEPLEVHGLCGSRDRRRRVGELLELVGLRAGHMDRYPHEFSGGQRQRIAIARALAVKPDLLICDEAVSALDVSTQNQIVNLIRDLQREMGMACLFITHDLALVGHVATTTVVMYLGQVVEMGPTEALFANPAHPYTRALLSAIPIADPVEQRRRKRLDVRGEIPDPAHPPTGCSFRTRCPFEQEICRTEPPRLIDLPVGRVACHRPFAASTHPADAPIR